MKRLVDRAQANILQFDGDVTDQHMENGEILLEWRVEIHEIGHPNLLLL
jgi:hypothetical protein